MPRGDLHCPNGCLGGRFEALNAPVFVNRRREYIEHDDSRATFVCSQCQSVAVDLAEVGRAMGMDREPDQLILVCPSCGTEMLPPLNNELTASVECPACETAFALEEGMPRLHGTGYGVDE